MHSWPESKWNKVTSLQVCSYEMNFNNCLHLWLILLFHMFQAATLQLLKRLSRKEAGKKKTWNPMAFSFEPFKVPLRTLKTTFSSVPVLREQRETRTIKGHHTEVTVLEFLN